MEAGCAHSGRRASGGTDHALPPLCRGEHNLPGVTTLRLVLVRHGQTDWNRDQRIVGLTDVYLNGEGQRQAKALAQALEQEPIAAVYSSPLTRALHTSQGIAALHGMEVQVAVDLREMDSGDGEGLKGPEFRQRYGHILTMGSQVRFPNGESLSEVQERAWSVVEEIRCRHVSGTAVVVSHALVTVCIIYRALNLDLGGWGSMRVDPGSKSVLDFGSSRPRLSLLNDTCHLSEAKASSYSHPRNNA